MVGQKLGQRAAGSSVTAGNKDAFHRGRLAGLWGGGNVAKGPLRRVPV